MKNKTIFHSFKNAFCGIKTTFITERNFKLHMIFAGFAVCAGIYFKLDKYSFLAVTIAISLVLTAELMNTAIEAVVDLYCGEKRSELAKKAKDAAAAAVLVSSVFAALVGIAVFSGKVAEMLGL